MDNSREIARIIEILDALPDPLEAIQLVKFIKWIVVEIDRLEAENEVDW